MKGAAGAPPLKNGRVYDIPSKFVNTQTKFSSGFFSFRPEDVGGGVLPDITGAEPAGSGPENDKGYWAVQWGAPLDANGQKIVIIEGKFWANLTENQPVNYLKELS